MLLTIADIQNKTEWLLPTYRVEQASLRVFLPSSIVYCRDWSKMVRFCVGRRDSKGALCVKLLLLNLCVISTFFELADFAAAQGQGQHSVCQDLQPSPALTPYIDPLPLLKTIDISDGKQIIVGAYKITQKLHSELPPTTLYTYGTSEKTATFPGPTLLATRHKPSYVRWENHIHDSETFLITDRSLHWANPKRGGVPIVTHLHGGELESTYDGHPDAWFTASGETGKKFVTQNYTYPNSQPSALLWYHDHTVGITRNNVLAGLEGLYIIRSPSEEPKHLPSGDYEISLIIQDKQFWANGSINFPDIGDSPSNHPNWCPEYFGDTILVNGMVWPYLNVYPTKYRFRLLSAANARFFNLTISEPSLKFIQIGTDGGFLPFPLRLSSLTLGPAYRADVIIDFSGITPGTKIYLNNSAPAPFPSGDDAFLTKIPSVLEFRVIPKPQKVNLPSTRIPQGIIPVPKPAYSLKKNVHRKLTLTENDDDDGNPLFSLLNNQRWDDPVTETPKLGSVEVWDIINLTPDAHPIHLHLISFLFVHQQEFNQTLYEEEGCSLEKPFGHPLSCFIEPPQPAKDEQVGWKDTVVLYPSKVSRLWSKWTNREGQPFPFDATSGPGYVWHCHILDHEDNDMMRPLSVLQ
ncbi:hypothetical protein R1sor_013773 [Riccia sorocarpa]|uniref:Uncharacterized protein n=1 Tax=Riccia sorocarpa TaxID=122646 RepID=A0ABD3HAE4_9MARC